MIDKYGLRIVSAVFATLALIGVSSSVFASGGAAEGPAADGAHNDVSDVDSLQRGARNFMNYCSGCHSAKYVRYNTLAEGLGLDEQQVMENLMFNAEKMHETIRSAMPATEAERWFGVTPPDLSLVARSKGADYLYNFLRSFYLDDTRPSGVNNMLLAGASMPNVLWELQGLQRAVYEDPHDAAGQKVFTGFESVTKGSLSHEEFDRFVRDTVNFLDYIGEPMQLERRALGVWVLMFLLFFFFVAYLLKKEIWKDVH